MKNVTHALLGFVAGTALLALIAMTTGCAHKRPRPHATVHVAHVPYRAHFDAAHCRYLPDGVRFKCKDVVFDPREIDATGSK
jgi:hypothetical protein